MRSGWVQAGDRLDFVPDEEGGFKIIPLRKDVSVLKGRFAGRTARPVSIEEVDYQEYPGFEGTSWRRSDGNNRDDLLEPDEVRRISGVKRKAVGCRRGGDEQIRQTRPAGPSRPWPWWLFRVCCPSSRCT